MEFYPTGTRIDKERYVGRVESGLESSYLLEGDKIVIGASDGARDLKWILEKLGCISVLSKFHYKRNKKYLERGKFENYFKRNLEGIKNGDHPLSHGYSAEGDIAHKLKSKLGFGNKVGNLDNFKKLLIHDGVYVSSPPI